MMWARKVRRSTTAAARRGSEKVCEPAWDPRRLHTLEVRMEHEYESPGPEEVAADHRNPALSITETPQFLSGVAGRQ